MINCCDLYLQLFLEEALVFDSLVIGGKLVEDSKVGKRW